MEVQADLLGKEFFMNGSLVIGIVVAIILIVAIVKIVKAIYGKKIREEEIQRDSDLLDAVKRGDGKTVQRLVEEGADIYYEHGAILLENAIKNCDKGIISFLLDKGVDVNFVYEGRVPLACSNDEEIIALLKSRGAKTKAELDEAKSEREREAKEMREAAKKDKEAWEARQREEAVRREEQEREAREKEEAAKKERLLFIHACSSGDINVVKNFIQNGFDLEARYEKGRTALMIVINSFSDSLEKYNDIAKLLIQSGAEIDARDDDGFTALMHSAMQFPYHMPLLIESGADVNARSNKSFTVLMYACVNSAKIAKPVEFLISKGADVNAKENSNGETALMFATAAGNIEAVVTLIENGADVNARARNGATALSSAISSGYTEIKNILINSGAYR